MRKTFLLLFFSISLSQESTEYIDGIAAIVEDRIILKSDLAQMINMAAIQNKIDPRQEPGLFIELQNTVLESMIDQKILLEMAAIDSIEVTEKEVEKALDQQIELLVSQSGGEVEAEKILGQSIKSFRREFWFDIQDRLVSEKYQQQLMSSVNVDRESVNRFYFTYKDSLPMLPFQAKLRHLLVSIQPSDSAKQKTIDALLTIKKKIISGGSFSDLAKEYSMDPGSKDRGGDLGWVNRGSLVKRFETVAFTLDEKEISDPVETEFGYHLIQTIQKEGNKIKVRHILIIPEKTEDDNKYYFNFSNLLKDSIKTLDGFKLFVKKYSADKTTKEIGGDLGWINPESYPVPEIGQAIKYVGMNECSPPINSKLGFHLLWVEAVKKGGRPNPSENWPELEEMTLSKIRMDWYKGWIEKAREKFNIQIKQ